MHTSQKGGTLLLAGSLILTLAACGADAESESSGGGGGSGDCVLTLGTLGPLTGPAADFGLSMEAATKFVAWEANQNGGLQVGDQTCTVEVSSYDTGYTSAGAATGATEFASQGIKFVVGPLGATELTGMKPVAARYDMLLDANGFGREALEEEYPLVFHLGPGPFVWSGPIIEEAKKHFDFETAKVIATNDESGDDIAIINEEKFAEAGIDVTRETYQRGTQDFAPIVARLMRGNPDVIDFASSPAVDAGTMMKQLRQAGYDGVFARLGGESTAEILRVAGEENVQDFFYYAPVDHDAEEIVALKPDFKEATGMEATGISLGWIPGARTLLESIEEAGTIDDTEAVAEVMRENDLSDPTLGQGVWTGEEQFGVNQEMSWPFFMGLIKDGAEPTFTELSAD
ncbi:ABC transporter substrate-binding protein [Ornithinimicrobium murale]|uniref:ABC transporter substrate-binding protein n=1 Tax=Ornithinimicrobium murale TaxID=1050153 RepID=UPI000E0D981F|nr:ABC transporter substrate-binding protein [Ornithinimicrobium murale]